MGILIPLFASHYPPERLEIPEQALWAGIEGTRGLPLMSPALLAPVTSLPIVNI